MRLFISYSTGDLEIVSQIADALRPHADTASDGIRFDGDENFFGGEAE